MPHKHPQARSAVSRANLLAAARHLFMTQGIDSTSMQQVVAEAGTSIGNCYFYFPNKDALAQAVTEDIIMELEQEIDAIIATQTGPARVAISIYANFKGFLLHREVLAPMLLNSQHGAFREAIILRFRTRLRRAIETFPVIAGRDDLDMVVETLIGSFYMLIHQSLAGHIPDDPAVLARFMTRWTLQGIGAQPQIVEMVMSTLDGIVAGESQPG